MSDEAKLTIREQQENDAFWLHYGNPVRGCYPVHIYERTYTPYSASEDDMSFEEDESDIVDEVAFVAYKSSKNLFNRRLIGSAAREEPDDVRLLEIDSEYFLNTGLLIRELSWTWYHAGTVEQFHNSYVEKEEVDAFSLDLPVDIAEWVISLLSQAKESQFMALRDKVATSGKSIKDDTIRVFFEQKFK